MYRNQSIAVVIPCHRVVDHVLGVIAAVPDVVDRIICVDDACPDGSGRHIEANCTDPRVRVIFNPVNLGVGGAVKAGYRAAREAGCDIAVKIDGDGQMDPRLVTSFLRPIALGLADYTKGNRFFRLADVTQMPKLRLVGNAALSFLAKMSTGYWNIFDPTNGYTALHLSVLELVDLDKVADRYFFESDLLFRLNIARCVVRDIPMPSRYGGERSGLNPIKVLLPFLVGHVRNFVKRVFYNYFLRDFHVASVLLLFGGLAMATGLVYGGYHWWLSYSHGILATAGTVMIGALLIIIGLQMMLSALSHDMSNTPKDPIHPELRRED